MQTGELLAYFKKYFLVRNTFHNKSHNNASALASHLLQQVLESTGAQNIVQKVRKLALVGIISVPNHVFFFSSDPGVSSPTFVGDK